MRVSCKDDYQVATANEVGPLEAVFGAGSGKYGQYQVLCAGALPTRVVGATREWLFGAHLVAHIAVWHSISR